MSYQAAVTVAIAVVGVSMPVTTSTAQSPTPVQGLNSRVLERILVKVNGEIISQSDLEDRQVAAIRGRGLQPSTNAELFQLISEVTPEVLATAVEELLLVQRGKELGYQLSNGQFREFLDNLKTENGFETDEEFIATLERQEGMTLDDFRRLVERQMLSSQVQQVEILNRVTITEVESREYYDSHLDEFTEPATATLREILVAVADESPVSLMAHQQARTRADEILQRIAAGEDFTDVATAVSDASSKASGGLIGPFQLSDISETIKNVIAELDVGGVSDVMRTPEGYQLLKLEARTEDVAQPFEEVRDQISESVFNDRRLEEYREYLDRLRDEAIIEWKSEDLRAAYEEYLTSVPVATLPR